MSKIRCIIIEDEPLAVKVLADYTSQVPYLELQGSFRDAIRATEFLRQQETDLIFLDIHLPKLKGMAFLRTLVNPPAVIITTAYHQYAVEGFELNVTDYLLKPIEFERFLVAVNKVRLVRGDRMQSDRVRGDELRREGVERDGPQREGMEGQKAHEPLQTRDFIFLTVQKKKVKILFPEILYVESQKEYIKITTTKRVYVSKMSTHEIEALLPGHLFKRVHRSYIVALDKIESYTADMVEVNGVAIPIGRGYRDVIDGL